MRQLTSIRNIFGDFKISKLPMRQLTIINNRYKNENISKLPMRQLTFAGRPLLCKKFSKLPMRQLTVVFCANILMLLKLAAVYSYLTKILDSCQNP